MVSNWNQPGEADKLAEISKSITNAQKIADNQQAEPGSLAGSAGTYSAATYMVGGSINLAALNTDPPGVCYSVRMHVVVKGID